MKDLELEQLFLTQLKNFYGAENQIAASLPRMIGAANSEKLKNVLASHLEMTRNQVSLLEKVFESLGEVPGGQAGPAIEGLLKEDEDVITASGPGDHVRDAALIIAARKINHYEMACYGSLATLAGELGDKEAEALLASAEAGHSERTSSV